MYRASTGLSCPPPKFPSSSLALTAVDEPFQIRSCPEPMQTTATAGAAARADNDSEAGHEGSPRYQQPTTLHSSDQNTAERLAGAMEGSPPVVAEAGSAPGAAAEVSVGAIGGVLAGEEAGASGTVPASDGGKGATSVPATEGTTAASSVPASEHASSSGGDGSGNAKGVGSPNLDAEGKEGKEGNDQVIMAEGMSLKSNGHEVGQSNEAPARDCVLYGSTGAHMHTVV